MANNYKYKAFISYSHSDEKWAAWLHKALETYRVPKHIVGESTEFGPVPSRIAPIFRDREELPTATNLGEVLTQALDDSACQIVICSPRAAQSHWTNEEILTFKRLGRSARIFCLIVDGEPGASSDPETADQECFPPALIHEIGEDGELTDQLSEPIAADARKGKDNKNNAKLKLIAGMLGVGFDELRQREHQRKHRRMVALTAAAVVGMTITSGLAFTAYLARIEAEQQRQIAETEAETARQTTQFMVGMFEVADPSEALGNSITVREILDKGAERIDGELADQPEIQATLMDTMGTVYTSLGLYPEAARLVDKSVQKRRELFGDAHEEVASSLMHLGEVQALSADYEQAEPNLRESLEMRRAIFGNESAEAAEAATSLGEVLQKKGEFDAASQLFENALEVRRQLNPGPSTELAESLEDIGLNEYDQGNYERAVEFLRDALSMRRSLHGDVHPALAAAINNLAWALVEQRDLESAEKLWRESLGMQSKLFGDAHPELAIALNNYGYILEQLGEYEEAELTYRDALEMYRELLGPEHPEVANTLSNLAYVLYSNNEHEQAIAQLRQALRIYRAAVGNEHPATAATASNLGFWLMEQGEYEESDALLQESLAVRREVLGDSHPATAGTQTILAYLRVATEQNDEALEFAASARQVLLQNLPEDHWRVAFAKGAEGAALVAQGSYDLAEPLLLSSLPGLRLAPIPGLSEKGRLRLVQLYTDWGRPEEAEKFRTLRE